MLQLQEILTRHVETQYPARESPKVCNNTLCRLLFVQRISSLNVQGARETLSEHVVSNEWRKTAKVFFILLKFLNLYYFFSPFVLCNESVCACVRARTHKAEKGERKKNKMLREKRFTVLNFSSLLTCAH